VSRKCCNFASLFGSRGPRSELSGFFDALALGSGRVPGGLLTREIIEMFAVRKSDKQVRDKEGDSADLPVEIPTVTGGPPAPKRARRPMDTGV
jgi:hypothetical protein